MTIRAILTLFFFVIVAELVSLAIIIFLMISGQQDLATTEKRRYQAFRIADELRQSSDDLTRMARLYVVTADPIFEEYFRDILAIRNGLQPRPPNYDRIYWDLAVASRERPKHDGVPESLKQRMADLDLSPEELALLVEAQSNSDALVSLENTAMNAVKVQLAQGSQTETETRPSNSELAHSLIFGKEYHAAKASIMKPLDAFLLALSKRMNTSVFQARKALQRNAMTAALLVALTVLTFAAMAMAIGRRVIRPVGALVKQSNAIARGDYGYQVSPGADDELGILARAFNRMSQAVELDISRRTEAESALRESQQELRNSQHLIETILDQMPAHIFLRDTDGRFLLVNSRYEEIYDVDRNDIIGKTIEEVLPKAEAEFFRARDKESIETGRIVEHEIQRNLAGDERVFVSSKFPIRGNGDAVKLIGGVSFEITNLRRSEQIRLRQSKKLEMIGQMTGSIAHDFNNVMTVLSCNIPLLNSQRVSTDKRNELIKDCTEAVGMASNLTKRLMAIARKEPLDKTRVDLNDLLEDLADFLKSSVGQSATIEFSQHEAPLPVYVDTVLVEMALLNLVLNSRDAMPEGGLITVATDVAAVDSATQANWGQTHTGPYAILQVMDTGAGMTSEVKDKIFEVFFTTKEKGKGTGLGLSAVQDLAKESGGFIQIDSEPGQGATVKVFIPLQDVD